MLRGPEYRGWLPSTFPASVALVQHRLPHPDPGVELLGRRCALPVEAMRDGAMPLPGHVYLAPALGQAVIGGAGCFSIVGTAPGRGDPLLASAALAFKDRAIAVVLTGRGDDGMLGVRAIKSAAGRVLVQDDAAAPSMPLSAVGTGCADFVLPVRVIGRTLAALTSQRQGVATRRPPRQPRRPARRRPAAPRR